MSQSLFSIFLPTVTVRMKRDGTPIDPARNLNKKLDIALIGEVAKQTQETSLLENSYCINIYSFKLHSWFFHDLSTSALTLPTPEEPLLFFFIADCKPSGWMT